jgi:hypothetical protein
MNGAETHATSLWRPRAGAVQTSCAMLSSATARSTAGGTPWGTTPRVTREQSSGITPRGKRRKPMRPGEGTTGQSPHDLFTGLKWNSKRFLDYPRKGGTRLRIREASVFCLVPYTLVQRAASRLAERGAEPAAPSALHGGENPLKSIR